MKLSIGNVLLADTEDGSGTAVFGMSDEIARAVQIAPYIQADEISTFFRNNRQTAFSFSISREHASAPAAVQFMFTHESSLPPEGVAARPYDADLTIQPDSNDPSVLIRITGNLQKVRCQILGMRSTAQYAFVGGAPYVDTLTTEAGATLTTESGEEITP